MAVHPKKVFHLVSTFPLKAIWRRIKKRFGQLKARLKTTCLGAEITETAFRRAFMSEISTEAEFLTRIKSESHPKFFILPQEKDGLVNTLRRLCPSAEEQIVQAADKVCAHRFDLLGSGECWLGEHIDWQIDFKTGYRWDPKTYYLDIRYAQYPGGYDIKVPWELSRCQHFAWLGQAYWLTGDEKYTWEFRAQVEDWIRCNPLRYGVNWVCTMDVALRAVNWLWGYAYFRHSPVLDDAFHLLLHRSLLAHGRHILDNLEWSEKATGNHYLSDIVGLIYLGILLPEFKEAQNWRQFGLGELEKEIQKQIYSDGVNFEASTNYHRLSTELFLSATLLAERNGFNFSRIYDERLEQMISVVYAISRPDGTVPVIGDQDNGRVHRLKVWSVPEMEWQDFRPLLALGAVWKNNLDWALIAQDSWEEAVWMFGIHAAKVHDQINSQSLLPKPISTSLAEGGWYVLRDQNFHVVAELGPNGQNGNGGHAHNDSLSFDLFCQGQSWICDPGSYLYTADYDARNLFRSTQMHNTVSSDEYEQNQFDPYELFKLNSDIAPRLVHWEVTDTFTLLAGEFASHTTAGMMHRRWFYLAHGLNLMVLTDCVRGNENQRRVIFHFAPGVVANVCQEPLPGIVLVGKDKTRLWILDLERDYEKILVEQGWISMGYGNRQRCWTAIFEWEGDQPHSLGLIVGEEGENILEKIAQARSFNCKIRGTP